MNAVQNYRARLKKSFSLALLLCAITITLLLNQASATNSSPSFLRDAETEHYLRELSRPIFKAASLDEHAVNLLLVKNNTVNAFVAGGQNIFLHSGLIEKAESPEELQAVIAHETGHIEGGHILRGHEAMRNASAQAIIGMIAGVLAGMVANNTEVAMGTMGGAQSMAERVFLRFSRTQESSADSAAMRYLDSTGLGSHGLLNFMKKLQGQELLPQSKKSEYVRTHPLSTNRIEAIAHHIKKTKTSSMKLSKDLYAKHERVKAKLLGYLHPEAALLRYGKKDPRVNARYARALALYKTSKTQEALQALDSLIKDFPNDPFFIEQKAQILFHAGQVERAASLYMQARQFLPDSALVRIALAHALLEKNDKDSLDLAIQELSQARLLEQRNPQAWRLLATAWGRKAKESKQDNYQGLSKYALAEEAVALGRFKDAQRFAKHALDVLPKGSPYWLRAQDINLSLKDVVKD